MVQVVQVVQATLIEKEIFKKGCRKKRNSNLFEKEIFWSKKIWVKVVQATLIEKESFKKYEISGYEMSRYKMSGYEMSGY